MTNIQQNIAYPSKPGSDLDLLDPLSVQAYYKGQNASDSYFGNQMSYKQRNYRFLLSQVGKPTDRGSFDSAVDEINAYYQSAGNLIVIYAGIMQRPAFDPDLPWYVNYGGLGAYPGPRVDPRLRQQRQAVQRARKQGRVVGQCDHCRVQQAHRMLRQSIQRLHTARS